MADQTVDLTTQIDNLGANTFSHINHVDGDLGMLGIEIVGQLSYLEATTTARLDEDLSATLGALDSLWAAVSQGVASLQSSVLSVVGTEHQPDTLPVLLLPRISTFVMG